MSAPGGFRGLLESVFLPDLSGREGRQGGGGRDSRTSGQPPRGSYHHGQAAAGCLLAGNTCIPARSRLQVVTNAEYIVYH